MEADVDLYAIWEQTSQPVTYKVTYHGNGNTSGTVPQDNNVYQALSMAIVLSKGDLAKESHTFKEWNTKADGSGQGYQAGGQIKMTADVDLYAIWEIPEEKGQISIVKRLVYADGTSMILDSGKFYVALFNDEALTTRITDVKELTLNKTSSASVTFKDLEAGTYYFAETTSDGKVITEGELNGTVFRPHYGQGQKVTLGSGASVENVFTNLFATNPEEPKKDKPDVKKPGSYDKNNSAKNKQAAASVKSGDDTNIILWICIMGVAVLAVAAVVLIKRHKDKK